MRRRKKKGYKESRYHTGQTHSAAAEVSPPLSPPLQTSGADAEWNTRGMEMLISLEDEENYLKL